MANDTTLNPGVGGETIRDVDKGGIKTQVVIIDMGGGGVENIASTPATQATLAALLAELLLKAKLTDTQPVSAASLPLPAGAATDAGLVAILAELLLKARLTDTQPVSAAALPLPAGAATGARQDVEIASLASIDAKLTNPLPVNGTVTGNQGTPAATANAWPVKITDGSSVQAVKAASTAALAADPSSVVALSPNSPLPAGTNALGSVTLSALPSNAAQETGGNLATLVATEGQMLQMLEMQRLQLALLQSINLHLANMTGASFPPLEFLNETLIH